MTKQTILGRVSQLARADIDALLDHAEDPQKMIDQLIRDYTGTIRQAEEALSGTLGDLRLLEQDHAEDVAAAAEWGGRALTASRRADELRAGAAGSAEADRFDGLARIALGRQLRSEREARAAEPVITAQTGVVDRLKAGLDRTKDRLTQLQARRDEWVFRSRAAGTRRPRPDTVSSVDVFDPTGELGWFEEKVRREEIRAQGRQELAASPLDARFESPDPCDDAAGTAEIDARLARLKSGA